MQRSTSGTQEGAGVILTKEEIEVMQHKLSVDGPDPDDFLKLCESHTELERRLKVAEDALEGIEHLDSWPELHNIARADQCAICIGTTALAELRKGRECDPALAADGKCPCGGA